MFKLPHKYTHLTHKQSKAQNSPSQASTVREPWTSRCSSWIRKGRGIRDQIGNIRWITEKTRRVPEKHLLLLYWPCLWLCGLQQTVENSSRDGNTRPLWPTSWEICMQVKKQVRTGHGTTDWFQIRKGVHQGCILLPCLFNLYAEYIMGNAELDEAQAGVKIAGRNVIKLRYANDTTLMAESEELKSLLMKWKRRVKKLA